MRTHSATRFTQLSLLTALIVIGASALLNLVVDPFGVVGIPAIAGITSEKPEVKHKPRLHKAHAVARYEPTALILGSSRAEVGLDPDHVAWNGERTYNLALSGPSMYETWRYFQHGLAAGPVERAVIAVDFFMFNVNRQPAVTFNEERLADDISVDPRLSTTLADLPVAVLSLDTSIAAVKTLLGQSSETWIAENGLRPAEAMESRLGGGQRLRFERSVSANVKAIYAGFALWDDDGRSGALDAFNALLSDARANGIGLTFVIGPSHAWQWEALDELGLWPRFEEWKRTLVAALAAEAAGSGRAPFALWDFSGYSTYTTEPVPALDETEARMRWHWDSSHYSQALGDLVLDVALGGASVPGLGSELTEASVDAELRRIRDDQTAYRASNADEARRVAAIVADAT